MLHGNGAERQTSGQSNLTKRPHRRRTWTVQWYWPGGASVHLTYTCFLWPTPVHNPNGISIGSAIFAQLTAVLSGIPGHVLSPQGIARWRGVQGGLKSQACNRYGTPDYIEILGLELPKLVTFTTRNPGASRSANVAADDLGRRCCVDIASWQVSRSGRGN